MNEIVLAQHYNELVRLIKKELERRDIFNKPELNIKPLNVTDVKDSEVLAEHVKELQSKLDLIKKYDSNLPEHYKNPNTFINGMKSGLFNNIKYSWEVKNKGDLIVKQILDLARQNLDSHIIKCLCDCNYCSCDNRCACNCNYCACDCNYCTCDCNYKAPPPPCNDNPAPPPCPSDGWFSCTVNECNGGTVVGNIHGKYLMA